MPHRQQGFQKMGDQALPGRRVSRAGGQDRPRHCGEGAAAVSYRGGRASTRDPRMDTNTRQQSPADGAQEEKRTALLQNRQDGQRQLQQRTEQP